MQGRDVFLRFLVLRAASLLIVQTWFVADEYWQSLEVAHNWVFGYGYLTWEWRERLRGVFYPGAVAALYQLLALLHLDYPFMLTQAPRAVAAAVAAVGDWAAWKMACKVYGPACSAWVCACLGSSWFLQYCAPRTLSGGAEATASMLALAAFPWHREAESMDVGYLWWVGAGCALRPTTALFFLPLLLRHAALCPRPLRLLVAALLPTLVVCVVVVVADSLWYGQLCFTPWRFLHFNALTSLSDHYGRQPWHWYWWSGLPTVLGPHVVAVVAAAVAAPRRHAPLLVPCCCTLLLYSLVAHKELRLLLPLVAPLLVVAGDGITQASLRYRKKTDRTPTLRQVAVVAWLAVPSAVLLVYLGLVHQRGPLDVMPVLRELLKSYGTAPLLLFLTPCHSTPLYSHLHRNVSVRFLTCEPNLRGAPKYLDEAELFYHQPETWLAAHLPLRLPPSNTQLNPRTNHDHTNGRNTTITSHHNGNNHNNNDNNNDHINSHSDGQGVIGISLKDSLAHTRNTNNTKHIENEEENVLFNVAPSSYKHKVINPLQKMPTHIVMFDSLAEQLKVFLKQFNYKFCARVFHSHFKEGHRGFYFHIYCLPL